MPRFPLQTYLFLGLGILAAVPALLLGGVQTQQWGAQQVAQAERETQLAAELLARETGQLMAMHVREAESLARQVEAASRHQRGGLPSERQEDQDETEVGAHAHDLTASALRS